MRNKLFAVLIATLVCSAVVIAPAVAQEVPSETESTAETLAGTCEANFVCAFAQPEYFGVRYMVECSRSGNFPLEINYASATNRCGNKKNKLYFGSIEVACMNPGGNRPNPGTFTNIWLPSVWGTLC